MKRDGLKSMNKWNYRLIDGNPFRMVTLFNPLQRVHLMGEHLSIYIMFAEFFLTALYKIGYRG